jgi:hypothetical protein
MADPKQESGFAGLLLSVTAIKSARRDSMPGP